MKRPEGFDPARRPVPPARPATPPPASSKRPASKNTASKPEATAPRSKKPAEPKVVHQSAGRGRSEPEFSAKAEARAAAHSARAARRELTKATRNRRKVERSEARRFTRRSRNRQVTIGVVAGLLVLLAAMLAVAVYSPILALREVRVDGASQIDDAVVSAAVDDQLGTPLALIDFDRITTELGKIPLIRSYVTETIPPSTLVIHVVEREAVGVVKNASGQGGRWNLVDAAGVTLSTTDEKPSDMPQISVSGDVRTSKAFAEAARVLLALPTDLRGRVLRISASTDYNVSLLLKGKAGQKVVWGNADRSDFKARVLEVLIRDNSGVKGATYNLVAPDNAYVSNGEGARL